MSRTSLFDMYRASLPGMLVGALFAGIGFYVVATDPRAAYAHDPRECPPQDCAPCLCPPITCSVLETPSVSAEQIQAVSRAMQAIEAVEESDRSQRPDTDTDTE